MSRLTAAGPARRAWRAAAALALWLCGALASAQTPALRFLQNKDGLTNMAVMALAQDRDQRLWIGTENGLFRYDGERVEAVDVLDESLQDAVVSSLAVDGAGRLWIGMRQQLFVLDPDAPHARRLGGAVPVDEGATLAVATDGGAWVVSERRLLRAAAGAGAAAPAQVVLDERRAGAIRSVAAAADGGVWLGCGKALCHWDGRALERLGPERGVTEGCWARMLDTRDHALWIRSASHILRRPAGAPRFVDVTPPGVAAGDGCKVAPMAEDDEGRLLAFFGDGLRRWEGDGWRLVRSPLWDGADMMAMHVDRDGDLWLGTSGWGVGQWRGYRHWRNWTTELGARAGDTWGFAGDAPGRVWLASEHGAVLFDARGGRVLPAPPDDRAVAGFARDAAGRLWSGTFDGSVRRLDGDAWRPVARRLPEIRALLADGADRLLVATEGGVFAIPAGPGTPAAPARRLDGLEDVRRSGKGAYGLCAGGGRTWVSTHQGLLWVESGARLVPAEVEGLPRARATSLACDADEAWVVMEPGRLWRVARDAAGRWRARRETPEVLARRGIVSLMKDRRGWLWIGTDSGVVLHTPAGWRRFDESSGLVWPDADFAALYEDAAGHVWIGTSRGVSEVVDPQGLVAPRALALKIDAVQAGARALPGSVGGVSVASRAAVRVDWHVAGPLDRDSLRTSYRLLDSDDDESPWSDAGRGAIHFEGLAPGLHRLQVRAEDPDLDARSPVVTLEIDVLAPWWRSVPAVVAYAALLALLSYAGYRWRVRRLLRNERHLQALVAGRTRELEASREQLREQALRDPLTGSWNRRALMEILLREIQRAGREREPLAVVLADIDHFKRVNDAHGHPAGDAVLQEFTRRLNAAVRPYDSVGRYGGEEFLLVLPGLDLGDAGDRARLEALHASIAARPMAVGPVTCSFGAAAFQPGRIETVEALIAAADAALYEAKAAGRDRVVLAPGRARPHEGAAAPAGG